MISISPEVTPLRLYPVERIAIVPVPHASIVPVKTSVLLAYNDPSDSCTAEPVCVVVPAMVPVDAPRSENGITHDVGGPQKGAPTIEGSCVYDQTTVCAGVEEAVVDGSTTVVEVDCAVVVVAASVVDVVG